MLYFNPPMLWKLQHYKTVALLSLEEIEFMLIKPVVAILKWNGYTTFSYNFNTAYEKLSKGNYITNNFCTTVFQNHVYAVGGNDGVASLSSVEKYDPHLDKWIEVKEMGQRRAGNGVSELHGCLYVVGE